MEPTEKWIFLLRVRNRPGVLAALTALFADRGVSLDSLTAHDSGSLGGPHGTTILTFTASAAKKDYLARLLGRLEAVQSLTEYRYDDAEHARKSALVRVSLDADDLLVELPLGLLCDIVSETDGQTLALLLGPPLLLDSALSALNDGGTLLAMDSTVIVV